METYKKIQGFENYSVSDFGNVRNDKTGKIKNVNVDIKGYVRVNLSSKTERKNKFIQRLVARAFILNPENKPQVDHIDNNRANNNIKNLRWTTISQNTQNRQLTTKIHQVLKEYLGEKIHKSGGHKLLSTVKQ